LTYKIVAELAIDGLGNTLKEAAVVIKDSKIIFFGNQTDAPSADTLIKVPVIMPGLWECHAHFTGFTRPAVEEAATTHIATAAARATWDLKQLLKYGITSVREVGGLGVFLKRAVEDGTILGPRIYASGQVLSTTGGHGDIHNIALTALDKLGDMVLGHMIDGPEECLKGVRKQLRNGAEVIKICASGGVMSEIDHPMHQQFSIEEIRAITEEAARSEVIVAAHCHGDKGIKVAIEGGCKTIEHGTYLTETLAEEMIKQNIILVPTRYVIEKIRSAADDPSIPKYARDKLIALYEQHRNALRLAIAKKVPIAMGCDMFVSGPGKLFVPGENAKELEYLVNEGMTPMEAIIAGTSMGPKTLGPRAPKSGILKEGYDADILVLEKNPLEDITILQNLENIRNVIKAGKIISFD
jgi:imidazolonepropionase-like amidohydrolase